MGKEIMQLDYNRGIETVTSEICTIKKQTQLIVLQSAIEIGRRLIEAKALVPYGEWGKYLKEQVDFSQSTANNMMKLAEEYGSEQFTIFGAITDSQAIANLPYTKALKLLALPIDERDEFINENDVENMSTREMDKLIKERDEARRRLADSESLTAELELKLGQARDDVKAVGDEAEQNEKSLKDEIERLKADLEKKKDAEKKAKEKLKALQENPEIPKSVLDRLKSEAEAAASADAAEQTKRDVADAVQKQKQAELAAEQAKKETEQAALRLEAMEKQVKAASPEVTEFRLWFDRVQEDWNRMQGALLKVQSSSPDKAEKLKAAVSAVLKQWSLKCRL